MQIVIDISDGLYADMLTKTYNGNIFYAVKNGIPLPKHHGRLIDADELKQYKYPIDSWLCVYEDVVNVDDIDNAPTILEATKEGQE